MNINVRTILSATVGLGLAGYTVFSALRYDISAAQVVLGFSFLTIYGLLELAILSYSPVSSVRALVAPMVARVLTTQPVVTRREAMPVLGLRPSRVERRDRSRELAA